jgi:hypothetical protein
VGLWEEEFLGKSKSVSNDISSGETPRGNSYLRLRAIVNNSILIIKEKNQREEYIYIYI